MEQADIARIAREKGYIVACAEGGRVRHFWTHLDYRPGKKDKTLCGKNFFRGKTTALHLFVRNVQNRPNKEDYMVTVSITQQTPKTPKELAAGHLVGVQITTSLSQEPAKVISARITDDDWYHFDCENYRIIETNDITNLLVVCRGGCKTLFNPRGEYSPDLCDKCWMEAHNP